MPGGNTAHTFQGSETNMPSTHGLNSTLELCSSYNWGLAWLVSSSYISGYI